MPPRLRLSIAWAGALAGLALIISGLLLPDPMQWRLHLLVGLWLCSLLPRATLLRRSAPAMRGLAHLVLLLLLGFSAVGLQLTRYQLSQAGQVRERAAAILEPTSLPVVGPTATPVLTDRTRVGSGQVWPVAIELPPRGPIFDRNGVLLASTENGQRRYLNPNLGHIVGFESGVYGLSGVEASFDTYLSGAASVNAPAVLEARLMGVPVPAQAAAVTLTLDSGLQEAAQAALGQRRGAVVVIAPRTGAILALASYPRFDPNTLTLPPAATEADVARVRATWDALSSRADSPLLNRATQGRYPPGSIMKTLTAAAALDSGVLEFPESVVTCPNRLPTETGAPPVRNAVENLASSTGTPSDLRRVFAWSCNTAFAQIGLNLGGDRMSDYARRFGLGFANDPAPPALRDIAADAGTIANAPDFFSRPAALADTAFGQGQILVTPLDMAQMVALIANDGQRMRPYLVQTARYNNQLAYEATPEMLEQAISPASALRMRTIMQSSVELGYARPVALPGVAIGAKTGTAENPTGRPHAWFVALAPVDEPRFAIAVVVEQGGEGGAVALPVARQVLAAALR